MLRNRIYRAIFLFVILVIAFGCTKDVVPVKQAPAVNKLERYKYRYSEGGGISQETSYFRNKLHGTSITYWENGNIFSIVGASHGLEYYEIMFDSLGTLIAERGDPIYWNDTRPVMEVDEWNIITFSAVEFPGFENELSYSIVYPTKDTTKNLPFTMQNNGDFVAGIKSARAEKLKLIFKYIYRPSETLDWQSLEIGYVVEFE